jgi:hypothetical protein
VSVPPAGSKDAGPAGTTRPKTDGKRRSVAAAAATPRPSWSCSTPRRSPTRSSADQRRAAEASRDAYQKVLTDAGYGTISTEIRDAPEFYYAEDYHQQYLSDAKNPNGYCPDHGTGVACPVGLTTDEA